MEGEFIRVDELLMLLLLFAGPVYVLADLLLYWRLKRRGLAGPGRRLRAFGLIAGVTAGAIPLTVLLWSISGHLPFTFAEWVPIGWTILNFAVYVTPPAVVASLIAFLAAASLARRWVRPPRHNKGIQTNARRPRR